MTELTIGARPVDADVPCAACDYNLRGLPENGRCPECATPIARSLVLAKAGLTGPERSWLWGQVTACWILLAAAAWELSWGAGLVPLHGGPGSNVQPLLLDMRTVPHAVAALARRSHSSPPEFAEALVLFVLGTGWSLWFVGLLVWTCWRLTTALRAIGRRTEPSSPP